jgi:BirA family biotin operon repressor/biotin-[acetyl-CoA-carboxylase] ligase
VKALPLIHLATVDSTQAFLRRNAHLGDCLVLADAQTAGRGRQGNQWESPAGAGLWLSMAGPTPSGVLSGLILQRAMTAAAQVLDPDGRILGLKWPNDLVAWKEGRLVKLGGILGEQVAGRLILGLGVNLSAAPDIPGRAIPPACLKDMGLGFSSTPDLALAIAQLWKNLAQNFQPIFRWPEPDTAIRWEDGQGTCLGWEADGRLKVVTTEGVRCLSTGEVVGLHQA